MSLDALEVGGDVCSTVNSMTGCDGIWSRSVAVVGGGVDEDAYMYLFLGASRLWGGRPPSQLVPFRVERLTKWHVVEGSQ